VRVAAPEVTTRLVVTPLLAKVDSTNSTSTSGPVIIMVLGCLLPGL
jgi:hypothetical protein